MKELLRKFIMILMAAGFLAGFLVLIYPLLSNKWNEAREDELRTDYQNTVTEVMKDEKGEEEWKKAWDYNADLSPIIIPDSFIQAENEAYEDEDYMSCLNVAGDGVMGYISIPKIEVNIPISHSTGDEVLKKGAGHLHGSSLPAGGMDSHAVLAAHRGLPGASLFTDVDQLELGDQFYLYVLNDVLAYEVDQILTVEPQDTDALQVVRGEDLVTLVTCTPYAVNSHRLLVRGHRIPYVKEAVKQQAEKVTHSAHTNYILWIGVGLGSSFLFLALFTLLRKAIGKKRRRKLTLPSYLFIVLILAAFSLWNPGDVSASALQEKCKMTVILQCDHQPVGGLRVDLFCAADMDMVDGTLHMKKELIGNGLADNDLKDISIAKKNEELSRRIQDILIKTKIPPDVSGRTSNDGLLEFTDLKPGLYLFCTEETDMVRTIPGLISIPQYQGETTGWNFDVVVEPKTVPEEVTPSPTPSAPPEPSITPDPGSTPTGTLALTKKLTLGGEEIYARDQVFYVALYSDEALTDRVTDITPIIFQNACSSTVEFTGLEVGKTYYAAEVEEDGTLLEMGILSDDTVFMVNFAEGNFAVIEKENGSAAILFENEFITLPQGFYKRADIQITKQVQDVDGKPLKSREVFYVGLFEDEEYTIPAKSVSANMIPLEMNDNSSASQTPYVELTEGMTVKLYITEVDEEGTPVENQADFGYTMSIDTASVTLTEENRRASVTITNRKKPVSGITPTSVVPSPTNPVSQPSSGSSAPGNQQEYGSGTSSPVRTADETPITLYLLLLILSALTAEGIRRNKLMKK